MTIPPVSPIPPVPARYRGTCPTCHSPNLHTTVKDGQDVAATMVFCHVCKVWVSPRDWRPVMQPGDSRPVSIRNYTAQGLELSAEEKLYLESMQEVARGVARYFELPMRRAEVEKIVFGFASDHVFTAEELRRGKLDEKIGISSPALPVANPVPPCEKRGRIFSYIRKMLGNSRSK